MKKGFDTMRRNVIRLIALFIAAVIFIPTVVYAETADMKKVNVSWDLKNGRTVKSYTRFTGLEYGLPIYYTMKNLKITETGDGYNKLTFTLIYKNDFVPTDEQVRKIGNSNVDGSIGGGSALCIVDYTSGLELENDNAYHVSCSAYVVEKNEMKFDGSDGSWIRFTKSSITEITIIYPSDYNGLCIGVLGRTAPLQGNPEKGFWKGTVPFSRTFYYSKTDSTLSHFLRIKSSRSTPVTSITLNKSKATLKKGKTLQLTVKKILPKDATDKTVVWKSSNREVATVSSTGKVKAVGKGTCTITCTAGDGSGVKAKCKITVK